MYLSKSATNDSMLFKRGGQCLAYLDLARGQFSSDWFFIDQKSHFARCG